MLHTSPAVTESAVPAPRVPVSGAALSLPELRVVSHCGPARDVLENYVHRVFARTYGAEVNSFMPLLAGLYRDGEPEAAFGLRSAASQPLFCEHYLDRPVEHYASTLYGTLAPRQRIMELGNLAASRGGHSGILYLIVACALQAGGVDYLLFAANKAVRRSLSRCGFSPRPIQGARPECLPDGGESWGRYYDSEPVVMLADVNRTVRQAATQPGMVALMAQYATAITTLAAAVAREAQ
ncbi:hypothetical protein FV139_04200 [Parahaliea maris]|uniref:Thermostable hemolysin n=1 Tax=Parahaliea maris TaxID=2716870 RepID=A0A5C9A952_9GAMM|nr:thermostable hemolysin [Parahaliea maris]TXS96679.1 hypothetical protein FV139_04200 [Parahaliea maris]